MSAKRGHARESMISNKSKEIAAILIVGFALFAVVSTVTYEDDIESDTGNLCGATGHTLAEFMLYSVGFASYALYGCLAIWGIVLLSRKHLPAVISKVVGLVFFTIFLAAFLSHFIEGSPDALPGYGGLVGEFISSFLTDKLALGMVGTRIILVVLFLITFILATDWVFFTSILAFGRWINERAARMREKAAERRKLAEAKRRERQALKDKEAAAAALAAEKAAEKAAKERAAAEKVTANAEAMAEAKAAKNGAKKDKAVAEYLKKEEDKQKAAAAAADTQKEKADKKEPPPEDDVEAPADVSTPAPAARPAKAPARAAKPKAAPPLGEGDGIQLRPPPVKKSCEFKRPPLDLLENPEPVPGTKLEKMISDTSSLLERTLQSFKIDAEVVEIQRGPVITMFELELAPGIKVEKIRALEDDIAMAVKAPSVRIVAPIPGKSTVGIEVPNAMRETVRIMELFTSRQFKESKNAIPICLGKDAAGGIIIDDLAKMPHLLVAGSTGAGKSVCLNSIIMSILYTRAPEQVKLILVDPKMVELSSFKKIPHLMAPVVTDMKRAGSILEWATRLMDSRYNLLHMAGVRNIYAYNKLGDEDLRERLGDLTEEEDFHSAMPFIVIVVDELADLMMIGTREVEATITRLAQKSRAVGIHLVLATQRPSTNVITGLIKANMPTRIAFMVASKIDSRVILDINGAEKLLGQGDMLYMPPRSSLVLRAQGTFISDEEVRDVTKFLREVGEPEYEPELSGKTRKDFDPRAVDDLYEQAVDFIIDTQRGSASLLQRHFSIGYTRASRLIDLMNQDGVLGEYKGSQAREVLLTEEEWNQRKKSNGTKGKAKV